MPRTLRLGATVAVLTALAGPGMTSAHQAKAGMGRTMLARVVDTSGRSMVDFTVDDFVVEEAGESRDVLDVHVADYPVAILLDDGAADNLMAIKSAVARFITRIGERPVAVATLSNPSAMLASFDDERATVLAAVGMVTASGAAPQPLPVLANVAHLITTTGASFSAVVVVAGNPVDARQLVESTLLPPILETGAAIHVVERRVVASAEATDAAPPDLFQLLTEQTHGQYTTIFSSVSYTVALDRLADRLSTELMVDYLVPPDGTAGDVRAGVRRPGALVLGLGVK